MSKAGKYLGDARKLTASFVDANGDAVNPDTVTLHVIDPNGTSSSAYTYAAGQITRQATGSYYRWYTPSDTGTPGVWQAQWTGVLNDYEFKVVGEFMVYDPAVSLA